MGVPGIDPFCLYCGSPALAPARPFLVPDRASRIVNSGRPAVLSNLGYFQLQRKERKEGMGPGGY